MAKIKGLDYSGTRENEYGQTEYYIDDYNDWMTKDDLEDKVSEDDYWDEYAQDMDRQDEDPNY